MSGHRMMQDAYQKMFEEMEKILSGLTVDDLKKRPAPGANPIGWLCWHCIRSCDRLLGDIVLGKQVWIKDGWHRQFDRQPDPNDNGKGDTDAQVDALAITDMKTFMDYYYAVKGLLTQYLEGLTEEELKREYPNSINPGTRTAVYIRFTGVLAHNFQHIGQAGYIRGLMKGQGWYGR